MQQALSTWLRAALWRREPMRLHPVSLCFAGMCSETSHGQAKFSFTLETFYGYETLTSLIDEAWFLLPGALKFMYKSGDEHRGRLTSFSTAKTQCRGPSVRGHVDS